MDKRELGIRISSGLAGWLQNLVAQNLDSLHGEDAARFELIRILNAQSQWRIATSQRPLNWSTDRKDRLDIAILPWQQNPKTWYGAIEIKWPSESRDWGQERAKIIQDAVRLASIKTANLNASLLVIGGACDPISSLFDTPHTKSEKDDIRAKFTSIFPRNEGESISISDSDLQQFFPDYKERVPINDFSIHSLKVELVGSSVALLGSEERGSVYVWSCSQGPGRKSNKSTAAEAAEMDCDAAGP